MENNLKYKSVEYWNERYKEEESFEWLEINNSFMFNQRDSNLLCLGLENGLNLNLLYRKKFLILITF